MPPMDFQPQPNMGMPPAGMPPMDDGSGMPPMDNGQMNPFDTNFDAGVEADENEDPKKYIQQLTGKLSQSLRKYTENNGQPDIDLNKYVAGMIVKQAMEGLSPDDADEIIDKVKSDEDFSMDNGQNPQNPPQDQQMPPQQPPMDNGQNMMPPNEAYRGRRGNKLTEIVNSVIHNEEDETPFQISRQPDSYKVGPYKSRNFE